MFVQELQKLGLSEGRKFTDRYSLVDSADPDGRFKNETSRSTFLHLAAGARALPFCAARRKGTGMTCAFEAVSADRRQSP
jgi:hypothetical protein